MGDLDWIEETNFTNRDILEFIFKDTDFSLSSDDETTLVLHNNKPFLVIAHLDLDTKLFLNTSLTNVGTMAFRYKGNTPYMELFQLLWENKDLFYK